MSFISAICHATIGYGIQRKGHPLMILVPNQEEVNSRIYAANHLEYIEQNTNGDKMVQLTLEDFQAEDWEVV